MAYQVSCSIAHRWISPASQVSQYKFSHFALLDYSTRRGTYDLNNKFALIDMNTFLFRTGKPKSSHFCHTGIVICLRVPGLFNTLSSRRNRGSRLSAMERNTYGKRTWIYLMFPGNFSQ